MWFNVGLFEEDGEQNINIPKRTCKLKFLFLHANKEIMHSTPD